MRLSFAALFVFKWAKWWVEELKEAQSSELKVQKKLQLLSSIFRCCLSPSDGQRVAAGRVRGFHMHRQISNLLG
jgi:hypothetical protein